MLYNEKLYNKNINNNVIIENIRFWCYGFHQLLRP